MTNVQLAAMTFSAAVIKGCEGKKTVLDTYLKKAGKPVLNFQPYDEEGAFVNACSDFYDELLEQEPVLAD